MTKELYINGQLCDLEDTPSLIFQSPVFNDLDVIQSNRSAEINLPLTPRNRKAFGLIDRIDILDDSAVYGKHSAAYYLGGFPVFTRGYAMVTDVTDTINITLVWGNIDNFQPLFDASLRDLREQIIEVAGADYVEWNEDTSYLLRNSPVSPYTCFIAVDFGASLIEYAKDSSGNWYIPGESRQYWKYTHPSIYVEAVLNAIERYHGIIIEGKTALSRIDGHDLLIPLVSKNSGPDSWYSDRFEASSAYFTNSDNGYYPLFYQKDNTVWDKRGIVVEDVINKGLPSEVKEYKEFYIANTKVVDVSILSYDGEPIVFNGHRQDATKPVELRLAGRKTDGTEQVLLSVYASGSGIGNRVVFALSDIFNKEEVDVEEYNVIWWSLENFVTNGGDQTLVSARFIITPHFDGISFPSPFPIAENLPDMTHAEFLSALMAMAGGSTGLNYYMFFGGTNLAGWGARRMTTSYDYGAALKESSGVGEKFAAVKGVGDFVNRFGTQLARSEAIEFTTSDNIKDLTVGVRRTKEGTLFIFIFPCTVPAVAKRKSRI